MTTGVRDDNAARGPCCSSAALRPMEGRRRISESLSAISRAEDPVMMAARFVVDVQSVVSREKDPTEFGVVSIGTIHGGTAVNIIPDDVVLAGTIRSFKPEVRAKMLAGIERTAKAVAAMSNAPEPVITITEGTKAVINDPGVVATAEKVLKAAFGDKLRPIPPVTPSEDYSEFISSGVPSMFFFTGVYEGRVQLARLHQLQKLAPGSLHVALQRHPDVGGDGGDEVIPRGIGGQRERAQARTSEPMPPDLLSSDLRSRPPTVPPVETAEPQPASFDDAWPKAERARPGEISPQRRSGRMPPTLAEANGGPARREDQPEVTGLKSGVVDGMAYSLYSDGSIEAQMPEGMMRFASIDELRAHLDQRS